MIKPVSNLAQPFNVFISYSRKDVEFADQIDATLRIGGFSTSLDRHAIEGGTDWKERLGALIRDADSVIFVLTPHSAAAEMCAWEVQEAQKLNKRIMPVVPGDLGDAKVPERLAALNYIYFYPDPKKPGSGFGPGLSELVDGLKTDVEWLREHTRLLQRATHWETGMRPENRLLSGDDIALAKNWVTRKPTSAPEPTPLHLEFIRASEQGETRRQDNERQQLVAISKAQGERAQALEAAEKAFRDLQEAQAARVRARSVIFWGGALTAFVAIGAALSFAIVQRNNARIQQDLRLTSEKLVNRIVVGSKNEHGVSALKKICNEATTVTAAVAAAAGKDRAQEDRFWELYYGPMNLIELKQITDNRDGTTLRSSPIERAMVGFGKALKDPQRETASADSWRFLAESVRDECASFIKAG